MPSALRVVSWNVQGAVPPFGSKDRIRSQVDFIDREAGRPDLLLLNEVTTAQRDFWHGLLGDLGYGEIDTLDVSHPTQGGDRLSGKRFDHLFASEELVPESCRYDEVGLECSDHAPVIASFHP